MPLRLFVEKHIAKSITDQLIAKGVDVVRADEIGLSHADDSELLVFAVSQRRVMVTHDRDFFRLHEEYIEQGRQHYGIMYVEHELQGVIGKVVNELFFWHEAVEEGAALPERDIDNHNDYYLIT